MDRIRSEAMNEERKIGLSVECYAEGRRKAREEERMFVQLPGNLCSFTNPRKRSNNIMRRLLCFFAFGFTTFGVMSAGQSDSMLTTLIHEGDEYWRQFNNTKALSLYLEALKRDSASAEVLWRISRAYVDIGEHLPTSTGEEQEQQLATYEKAATFADRAVHADPKSSMAYTRRAIANGRIALFRGIWESVSLVKSTRADVDTALMLDPSNDVANYIMGRIHAKVSEKPGIVRWPLGLGWADIEEAIKYYERAIALYPDFIMYRLDCARAYVEEDEYEMAREHLKRIETLEKKDEDDDRFKQEARALLREIERD